MSVTGTPDVKTQKFILETEFMLPSKLRLTKAENMKEQLFIQLPRSMFVGVGQRGSAGCLLHSQMDHFSQGSCYASTNLT
jgi:hypothetical protein